MNNLKFKVLLFSFLYCFSASGVTGEVYRHPHLFWLNPSHGYPTFQVQLDGVDFFFKDEKSQEMIIQRLDWRKVKSKKILKNRAFQKMVKVVHQVLYPEGKKFHKKSEFFEVNTGEDLIQILEFVSQTKFNPTEKPLKFTYVILSSGGMYFSETGKSFLKNMISKHLVQSGVSREVIYAGELHFINSQEGAILVVDNSSGTYQPTNEHFELKRLKDLFEYNFSNLNVVTQAFNEK